MPTSPKPSVHVRLPLGLVDHLRRKADEQQMSLNSYMAMLLAEASGWKLGEKPRRKR